MMTDMTLKFRFYEVDGVRTREPRMIASMTIDGYRYDPQLARRSLIEGCVIQQHRLWRALTAAWRAIGGRELCDAEMRGAA